MKNIIKKSLILPILLSLAGCGKTSENAFTPDKYSLKIAPKYEQYVVGDDITESKANKKLAFKLNSEENMEVSYNGNSAIAMEWNKDVLKELQKVDPDIGTNDRINGRLLTAPNDATLIKVQGVEKNAVATQSKTAVDAPASFQEVEYDSNGFFKGNTVPEKYPLICRSIKTKSFSASEGFSVARSNVYLFNSSASYLGSSEDYPASCAYNIGEEEYARARAVNTFINEFSGDAEGYEYSGDEQLNLEGEETQKITVTANFHNGECVFSMPVYFKIKKFNY